MTEQAGWHAFKGDPNAVEVELFEVGGSLRDEILGIDNKDLDWTALCSQGWEALKAWAHVWLDRVFLVTDQHLTLRGIKDGEIYDIVMARKDGKYSDGRRPDSVEPGSLLDDLRRRDFRMNAMARGKDGILIDPFLGQKDLEDRIIHCVGEPLERFDEDKLRILRALRFSLTKGMTLSASVYDAIWEHDWAAVVAAIPVERRMAELNKMFRFDTPQAVSLLATLPDDLQEAVFHRCWLEPTNKKN